MSKVLGLDQGTNSIGWAVVDPENKQILKTGVRIFEEGVENLGEGEREISKNAARREYRQSRRQNFRRRMRKNLLMKTLHQYGMAPDPQDHRSRIEWFRLNPYEIRKKALYEKVELPELGRAFYHMIQRRGFLSNSRQQKDEEGKIYEGNPAEGKIGILQTKESLKKSKTLGEYLAGLDSHKERIRNRYTTRQMYIEEFEKIWEEQARHHKTLDFDLKEKLGGRKKNRKEYGYQIDGILFHQRPLRTQKYLIGKCQFEPKKTKCPVSAITFELFRAWQYINSIECNGEKLEQEDREKIMDLLLRKERPKFRELRKKIDKLDSAYKFNYQDDAKAPGTYTISQLASKKFFGESWFEMTEKHQEDIWHILFSFDDKDKLREYAIKHWNFDEDKGSKIAQLKLRDGYAHLSRKAINNILPFLKMGFTYDISVALGGIRNAFGEQWDSMKQEEIDLILDHVPEIIRSGKQGGYLPVIVDFLRQNFNLPDERYKKLYHHSVKIDSGKLLDRLPAGRNADRELQNIRNPVVTKALFELRKVVNALLEEFGGFDQIRIELARDLKASKQRRYEIILEQRRNEAFNDRARKVLEQYNQRITHENILKYKLWEECQHICPYTGKQIGIEQLFSGEVQIEHIMPWSRSLNDSFLNKTLCFADENREKGDRTPYEYYSEKGTWEEVRLRALKLFTDSREFPKRYQKYKQFTRKKLDDEEFIQRQLNDTRYLSRTAKSYLSKICKDIIAAPGQMTAKLRHFWGLDSILNPEVDEKLREDHRHHAIDALVMAVFKRSHLQELSRWNRYNKSYNLEEFPDPWEGFMQQAYRSIHGILVSHEKPHRLLTTRWFTTKKDGMNHRNLGIAARGQLHKETVFGRREHEGIRSFHVRKSLTELTTEKQILKIVDPAIRNLVLKRVDQMGGFVGGKIPEGTYVEKDGNDRPRWMIHLPSRNGDPVPVRKVRIRENIGNAVQLKDDVNKWVNPRNNHHILIYKDHDGNLREDAVTFWEAVERKVKGMDVYQPPANAREVINSLQINDMFLLGLQEDQIDWETPDTSLITEHLYRVQKISSWYYTFRLNTASKISYDEQMKRIVSPSGWISENPIKVKILPNGILQKINK